MGALQLPEQTTIKLGTCLLLTLTRHMNDLEQVKEVVLARGRDLLELLLRGIAGGINRSQLKFVADIISSMLVACITELSQWLEVRETANMQTSFIYRNCCPKKASLSSVLLTLKNKTLRAQYYDLGVAQRNSMKKSKNFQ